MKKCLLLGIPAVALMVACSSESDRLKSQIDSLKTEIQDKDRFVETLQEVGTIMDAIDSNRNVLRLNLKEGATQESYRERMQSISDYVKSSQQKLLDLERDLERSNNKGKSYRLTIKKLREDLDVKEKEIERLVNMVDQLDTENRNLITVIDLQEAELLDKNDKIEAKEQELLLIEARIEELMIASKLSEADAYFARAAAVEEAAHRTKLAPKKKRQTYEEALELYRKSLSLGNDEARAKIEELEKKVN